MTIYGWVFNRGDLADGAFCSEKCAYDHCGDDPALLYKGCPYPLDEAEAEELVEEEQACTSCDEPFRKD
jgi:hypothetical protein